MHSAHYRFHDDALYKSTFYLLLIYFRKHSDSLNFATNYFIVIEVLIKYLEAIP